MARGGTRTAAKTDDQRRRRNAPASGPEVVLSRNSEIRGPDLLDPPDGEWSDQTLEWYETWRTAPQSQVFEATDWMRLQMLAGLVQDYFAHPDTKLMAEIRQNEERLGATYTDRQRARMRIAPHELAGEQPGFAGGAVVTRMDDFRARLEAGV